MNIIIATSTLNKARAAARAGDHIRAARLALQAQRMARQCRARAAADVAFSGHSMAVGRGSIAARSCVYSPEIKAEAGRIRAESQYIHNGLR